jgi:sensor c-di-GMP phosphodiesterase-like protein
VLITAALLFFGFYLSEQLGFDQSLLTVLLLVVSSCIFFIINRWLNKHYSLIKALKLALKKHEFFPVYQPIYNKNLEKYIGVEVLSRWQVSPDEIIMPDFFIKEAEIHGLIIPLTIYIMDRSFKEMHSVLKDRANFYLSFNISSLHFKSNTFFAVFYGLIEKYSINPKQIILELTERELLNKDDQLLIKKMTELRAAGYSLAIDDYGTGHASISYLNNFPFNYLKIDKLFIHAIGTKAITESLNEAIIIMAKTIELTVIAEGVETEEQMHYLYERGVFLMQGWLYAKGLPKNELIAFLHENKE